MSKAPFVAFYPSDWLAGTADLTPAEVGIYIGLIARIYDNGGPIVADRKRLARAMNCPVGSFTRALNGLLASGKIVEREGVLTSIRAEKELEKRSQKARSASQSANARWSKKPIKTECGDKRTHSKRNANHNHNHNNPLTPLEGGGVCDVFDQVWKSANQLGRKRSSQAKVRTQLERRIKSGIDPGRIVVAVKGYYADCEKTRLGSMALDRFLADRLDTWLAAPASQPATSPAEKAELAKRLILMRDHNNGRWLNEWSRQFDITEQQAEELAA